MDTLLNAVIPVFGLMLAGFAAGRLKLLGAGASEPLNRFVFYCAMPALLFRAVATTPLSEALRWDFLFVFAIGIAAIALVSILGSRLIIKEDFGAAAMRAMNATYGNVGYLGIPLAAVAFGERGVIAAGLAIVLNAVLIVAPASAALEIHQRRGSRTGRVMLGAVKAIATNPLILAIALGLAVSGGGARLPAPIDAFFKLMGEAAGPAALFALGLYVSVRPLARLFGRLGFVTGLKLMAFPALVWLLALWVIPLEPVWLAGAVIMAGTPIGSGSFVLAERYGADADETSTAIVLSTALSIVTLGFLLVHFSA